MIRNQRGFVVSAALGIGAGIMAGVTSAVAGVVGAGALASGIGLAVGSASALGIVGAAGYGLYKLASGMFQTSSGKILPPAQVPGTPEYQNAQAKAREDDKRRRLAIADAGGTELTNPMGLSTKAPTTQKTVLGA